MLLKAKPWFGSLALARSPGGSDPWLPIWEEVQSLVQTESLHPCGGGLLAIDGRHSVIYDARGSRRAQWGVWGGLDASWQDLAPTRTRCCCLPGFIRAALWVNIML